MADLRMSDLNGVVLVDKPPGPTSFDVVRSVRRAAYMRRVGHAGTLDPLAEGLLTVCLGEGCKLVPFLQDRPKQYLFRIALGEETDSLDREGDVVRRAPVPLLDKDDIVSILPRFTGRIQQRPPVYSAVKQAGEQLYHKARRGEAVTPEPREVFIEALQLVAVEGTSLTFRVTCGKGTYIRALARDLAEALGTVGTVDFLRRTVCSGFRVEDAFDENTFRSREAVAARLVPMSDALPHLSKVGIGPDVETRIRNGNAIPLSDALPADFSGEPGALKALISDRGTLVAVARVEMEKLQPVRVFLNC